MTMQHDWMSRKKGEQLNMARIWKKFISAKGESMWGMSAETVAEFEDAVTTAENEYGRDPATKNPGTTVTENNAFRHLTTMMRDFKRRYLLSPPVLESDLANMGIKPRDNTPTPIAAPTKPAEGDFSFPSVGLVDIKNIRAVGSEPGDRSEYGVRIYCGILASPDEISKYIIIAPPKTGDDLVYSEFTRKKNHHFNFLEHRGKEVFFCMRYENSKGQAGPWGNIVRVFIP